MWRKLVRLNALACTTTAFDEPIGAVRAHPRHRLALEGAVEETAAVARPRAPASTAGDVLAELARSTPSRPARCTATSPTGNEPELDAIPGAVLRAAARHGISAPTVEDLVEIRARIRRSP